LQSYAHGCSVLLTSRPLTTEHLNELDDKWTKWQLEPFNEQRIIDYIGRWYAHTPLVIDHDDRAVDVQGLAKGWFSDPVVGPLTSNPLLLATLLMVHHLDGSLPNGRSLLYKRYVEGMLGLWDDRRQVSATDVSLSLEQKRQVLRQFALHLQLTGQDSIEEVDTIAVFNKVCENMNLPMTGQEVIALLRERSGLIVGPGMYSFIHKTVGEYLVADCVVQGDQKDASGNRLDRMRLLEHRDDDRWNAVIFLWAGLAPIADVESFIYNCIDVQNFALGYGILADQYDKFSVEVRRAILLELCGDKCESIEFDSLYSWGVGGPSSLSGLLAAFDYSIRTLGDYIYLSSLAQRAVMDGTLCWDNVANSKEKVKNFWWMSCAISPKDLVSWKNCFIAEPPAASTPEMWRYWVLEWAFFSSYFYSVKTLEDVFAFVNSYYELTSGASDYFQLAIISSISRLGVSLADDQVEFFYRLLVDGRYSQVQSSWLAGTCKWTPRFGGKNIDLLLDFKTTIEKSREDGILQDEVLYQEVKKKINTLIALRDSMPSEVITEPLDGGERD
jgi:hypothetical protein